MNKNILKNRKAILSAALVIAATASAFAQGNGIAGINEATSMVSSYFDPGTKLIYAIGAVVGLIGGVKVYGKFSSGDPDTSKTAASWFGACIFLIVAATILRSGRVQGLEGTVPLHLLRRSAGSLRPVRHPLHGRYRPVDMYRLRRGIVLPPCMADLRAERPVR